MRGKPRHFLALLILLAFAGQVLAAPFLCCHQSAQPGSESATESGATAMQSHGMQNDEEHCLSMNMAATETSTKTMMEQDGSHHGLPGSLTGDCDHLCLQCPAGAAIQAGQVVVNPAPALMVDAGEYFTPPSHLDGLFRPPITA